MAGLLLACLLLGASATKYYLSGTVYSPLDGVARGGAVTLGTTLNLDQTPSVTPAAGEDWFNIKMNSPVNQATTQASEERLKPFTIALDDVGGAASLFKGGGTAPADPTFDIGGVSGSETTFAYRLHFVMPSAGTLTYGCRGVMRIYGPTGTSLASCTNTAANSLGEATLAAPAGLISVFYVYNLASGIKPGFEIGLPTGVSPNLCSVQGARFPETNVFPIAPFPGNTVLQGGAIVEGNAGFGALDLPIDTAFQKLSAFTTDARHLVSGFRAQFTYTVGAGTSEGFAFVVQNVDPTSQGNSGASLGYGGLQRSFAIEFDFIQNAGSDPAGSHIAANSNWDLANSANHDLGSTSCCGATAVAGIGAAGTHEVLLEVSRPQDGSDLGKVQVWFFSGGGVDSANFASNPQYTKDVPWTNGWKKIFAADGRAFVGFTSAAGSGGQSNTNILIDDYRLWTVPLAAPRSHATIDAPAGYHDIARDVRDPAMPSATIMTYDSCGEVFEQALVTAEFNSGANDKWTEVESTPSGAEIFWWSDLAAAHELRIFVGIASASGSNDFRQNIRDDGKFYPSTISPAPISADMSTAQICCPSNGANDCCAAFPAIDNNQGSGSDANLYDAGIGKVFRVDAHDKFGNKQFDQTNNFQLEFFGTPEPLILASPRPGGGVTPAVEDNQYFLIAYTEVAKESPASTVLFVHYLAPGGQQEVNNQGNAPAGLTTPLNPVEVRPRIPADLANTEGTLGRVLNAPASDTLKVVYTFGLRDEFGNVITDLDSVGVPEVTVVCDADPLCVGGINPTVDAPQMVEDAQDPTNNVWRVSYLTTLVGNYRTTVTINTQGVDGQPAQRDEFSTVTTIVPNTPSVLETTLVAGAADIIAGAPSNINLQARDEYGNARTSANPDGDGFEVVVRKGGVSVAAYDCESNACDDPAGCGSDAASVISDVICIHTGQGNYRVFFTYTHSTSRDGVMGEVVLHSKQNAEEQIFNVDILAAAPDCTTSYIEFPSYPYSVVAGDNEQFDVHVFDRFDNPRSFSNAGESDEQSFQVFLRGIGTISGAVDSALAWTATNQYTVSYMCEPAGSYRAEIRILCPNPMDDSNGDLGYFTVEPSTLDFAMSDYTGSGAFTAVRGQQTSLTLIAKDRFGNKIIDSADTVTASLKDHSGSVQVSPVPTVDGSVNPGRYVVTYTPDFAHTPGENIFLTFNGVDVRHGSGPLTEYDHEVVYFADASVIWSQLCAQADEGVAVDNTYPCAAPGYGVVTADLTGTVSGQHTPFQPPVTNAAAFQAKSGYTPQFIIKDYTCDGTETAYTASPTDCGTCGIDGSFTSNALTTCGAGGASAHPPQSGVLTVLNDAQARLFTVVLTKMNEPQAGLQVVATSEIVGTGNTYKVEYTPELAGGYVVEVRGGARPSQQSWAEMFHQSRIGLFLEVLPGDLFPGNSPLNFTTSPLRAGQEATFFIDFFDEAGNDIIQNAGLMWDKTTAVTDALFDYSLRPASGGPSDPISKAASFLAEGPGTYLTDAEFLSIDLATDGFGYVTFKPKKAGEKKFSISVPGSAPEQKFGPGNGELGVYRITILPDVADETTSCLEQPQTNGNCPASYAKAQAGTQYVTKFYPKDKFVNDVLDASLTFTISLEGHNDSALGATCIFRDNPTDKYYELSFTPTIISGVTNNLQVFNPDLSLAGNFEIEIYPGPVSETTSYVTGLTQDNEAGVIMDFEIHLRDAYDNAWGDDLNGWDGEDLKLISIQMSGVHTDILERGSPAGGNQEPKNYFLGGSQGVVNVQFYPTKSSTFAAINPTEPWFDNPAPTPLTVGLFANNAPIIPMGQNSVDISDLRVVPSVADPTLTYPTSYKGTSVLYQWQAGLEPPTPFVVTLRDRFRNPLRSGGDDLAGTAFYYDPVECSGGEPVNTADEHFQLNVNGSYWMDNEDGSYTLHMVGEKTGTFFLDINVNGESISVCGPKLVRFKIVPGPVYPPKCLLSGPAIEFPDNNRAGIPIDLEVLLADRFGNLIMDPLPNGVTDVQILAGAPGGSYTFPLPDGVPPNENPCYDVPEHVNRPFLQVPLDGISDVTAGLDAPRTYRATINETVAQVFNLAVWISKEGDGNWELAGWEVGDQLKCRQLTILPYCVYNWTTIAPTVALRAGVPGAVIIIADDKYGNRITGDAGYHFWNAISTLTTKPPTRYYFLDEYKLTVPSAAPDGLSNHEVAINAHWPGNYSLALVLVKDPRCLDEALHPEMRGTTYFSYNTDHATCQLESGQPYRCADGSCGSSCPAIGGNTQTCLTAGGARECSSGATATDFCSDTTCPVPSAGRFPTWAGGACSGGAVKRMSGGDCPAARVCPTFMVDCGDGRTCAFDSEANCPSFSVLDDCPAGFPTRCANGKCVSDGHDCPTPTTCATGQKACPDGSCQANAASCPSPYRCYAPNTFRCFDGSCRQSEKDCPSQITCPPGWLKCPNNHCRQKYADCDNNECPLQLVRCPDGSCIETFDLCPSTVTCPPTAPVLCADRTCVSTLSYCTTPPICSGALPVSCPSGDCAARWEDCSTNPTCPVSHPVLCPDGTCHETAEGCVGTERSQCPVHEPFRCLDGSCRAERGDCPTLMRCSPDAPVRCATGGCVPSSQLCPQVSQECAVGHVACPGGGCAAGISLCPTPMTCPPGMVRCGDSSCRETCAEGNLGAEVKRRDTNVCPEGTFNCPNHESGFACVLSIADCPQALTCPRDKPVRCPDRSCRLTVDMCPPSPEYELNKLLLSCPGGTWDAATASTKCGQSTTCPPEIPVKCWDDSCRLLPGDCPPEPKCILEHPDRTKVLPYLCSNGDCGKTVGSCKSNARCPSALGDNLVKCPLVNTLDGDVNQCQENVADCADFSSEGLLECADGNRCFDGSCQSSCPEVECPHFIGTVCKNGLCARSDRECPEIEECEGEANATTCVDGSCRANCNDMTNAANSCPANKPVRCPNGVCASSYAFCYVPMTATCSIDMPYTCQDGTCALTPAQCVAKRTCEGDNCPGADGCPSGQTKCPDGTCVAAGGNCPAKTHSWDGCPVDQVKCWNGKCAANAGACASENTVPKGCSPLNVASADCGLTCSGGSVLCADDTCASAVASCKTSQGCPMDKPFLCVDGTCAKYPANIIEEFQSESCQAIPACPPTYPVQCRDGSCVTDSAHCPGFGNGCPAGTKKCGKSNFFDHCVPTEEACPAEDTNVCPPGAPTLCPSGACRVSFRECAPAPGRICSWPNMFKCFDGACVEKPGDCIARGADTYLGAAFEPNAEAQCADPDTLSLCWNGACYPKEADYCPLLTACPPEHPYRCWDGSCHNNTAPGEPDSCPEKESCPSKTRRCADGTCRDKNECPAFNGCDNEKEDQAYHCRRKADACVENYEECSEGLQEACEFPCSRDIAAQPQHVSVPITHDIRVDVSLRELSTPNLWLDIPAGAFKQGRTSMKIRPVPLADLDRGSYVLNKKSVNVLGPQVLRSTPFKCEIEGQDTKPFELNVTVWGKVDRQKFAPPGETPAVIAPCEFRGAWSGTYGVGVPNCDLIPGNLTLGQDNIMLDARSALGNADCPVWNLEAKIWKVVRDEPEDTCVCYNVSSIGADNTEQGITADQPFCITFTSVPQRRAYFMTDPSKMGECPTIADDQPGRLTVSSLTSDDQICALEGTNDEVRPNDLCFGWLRGRRWECQQDYYERLSFPAWEPASGQRSYVLRGRMMACHPDRVYGFLNIPLPPEPINIPQEESWWSKYKDVVLGVGIPLFLVLVCVIYALSRLIRYRKKYHQEREEADELRQRTQEYHEKMGGLGVWEEEMEMVTNPLVLQISEEKRKLDKVNAELDQQEQMDEETAERLEKERRQIAAEMERLTAELEKAQSNQTARADFGDAGVPAATTTASGGDAGADYGDDYGSDPYGDDGDGGFGGGAAPKRRNL